MNKNLILLALLGLGMWYFMKKETASETTGLGIGGRPRFGRPRSEAERRLMHRRRFGTEKLSPRGTGIRRLYD
ncbi:MAG TPA: hypothetical protein ENG63_07035 [Candidatus Desulfofervidus auxilii]|uniref:Uncharacterized protein n=1 Tax=Desulfofervidus auxilii TaxID=1621989 RepID=A0A7C0U3D8_DESA2|nr:hypothetical protein [Candidatus Desulfofervidus auxilii]